MKLPAVAIAAAFAGGILLGMSHALSPRTAAHFSTAFTILIVCLLVATGFLLLWRNFVWTAAATSLAAWIALGILAACLVNQPLPAEHILTKLSAHQIPQKTPLRWHGTLQNEPEHLPWGYVLELNLDGVELAEGFLPVSGGMRVGFTPKEDAPALPELHAGDELTLLTVAHLPLNYKDAGAFDRRDYLARQGIHLVAALRASALLEKTGKAPATLQSRIASVRASFRNRLDAMFPSSPATAGILRAMLLGDRSFVDRAESVDYQKTGVFHVLVVAGLHVGALAFFLFWLARKLRLPHTARSLFLLVALIAYVAVVEQRASVLRAGVMAAIVILGTFFYRRLDLLNSASIAALVLLLADPVFVNDTGFLLSFLAIGAIAGLAMPLMQRNLLPLQHALQGWRDVTRDTRHAAALAQFRLDFRDAILVLTAALKGRYAKWAQELCVIASRTTLRLAELFVLSFVLQLGMLPLLVRDFHRVSLLGPIVNLFAVPLTGAIVPIGFFSLAIGSILPSLGRLLAHPLAWLILLQTRIVSFFAAIPHGSYRIPGPPAWVMALFFLAAIAAVIRLRSELAMRRWEWGSLALSLLLTAGIIATYPFRPSVNAGSLEVTVLDVGQGDSILVVSPKGSTLLIDGGGSFQGFHGQEEHLGPDPGEEAVSAYLWSRGFQRLDAVALTHAHQDHIGGLTAVLQNFRVSRLWLGRETAAPAFDRLKQLARGMRIPIEHERTGQSFFWDGVQVDILWPEITPEEIAPLAKNNDSLVVRLQYKDRSILLPGDAEKQVEYSMLGEHEPAFLHADVLKVGHHGSKNSTMPEFLSAVAPQITIISAGEENPYGHPHPELIERLEGSGARILRTDQNGAVQILTDGHTLRTSCFVPCPEPTLTSGKAQPPDCRQRNQQ
jgi:competence protein ComEC